MMTSWASVMQLQVQGHKGCHKKRPRTRPQPQRREPQSTMAIQHGGWLWNLLMRPQTRHMWQNLLMPSTFCSLLSLALLKVHCSYSVKSVLFLWPPSRVSRTRQSGFTAEEQFWFRREQKTTNPQVSYGRNSTIFLMSTSTTTRHPSNITTIVSHFPLLQHGFRTARSDSC